MYPWCPECLAWHAPDKHFPLWTVWCPEDGADGPEDGRTVRAFDADQAAERWADHDDCNGDYDIVSGRSTPIVHVQGEDEEVTRWKVTGEAEPVYTAHSLPLEEPTT